MRILILSMAALIVWSLSSCTKESALATEPLMQEEALRQKSLDDMNHALQETMEVLEPLKKLSDKEVAALKSSTDMPSELAKLGVDVEAFQRYAQRFSAAYNTAQALGTSEEGIFNALVQSRKEIIQSRERKASGTSGLGKSGLPCYDEWEANYLGIGATAALCFVSGPESWVACTLGTMIALWVIEKEFASCLANNY